MGALYQNVCYPSQETARVHVCSGFDLKALQGADVITTQCTSIAFDGLAMDLCKRTNGGTCTTLQQPWPLTPECAHDGGVTLAYDWFVASIAFLCIVWGGKKLIDLFNTNSLDT